MCLMSGGVQFPWIFQKGGLVALGISVQFPCDTCTFSLAGVDDGLDCGRYDTAWREIEPILQNRWSLLQSLQDSSRCTSFSGT